jgi:hypothetical protein
MVWAGSHHAVSLDAAWETRISFAEQIRRMHERKRRGYNLQSRGAAPNYIRRSVDLFTLTTCFPLALM